ncbi:MAG: ATP-binding protein [Polyangiales bacterium]
MEHDLSTREAARVALIRTAVSEPDGLTRAFLGAARLSARTLKVARVGIWFFVDGHEAIVCRYLYDFHSDTAIEGEVLDLTACPSYAAALKAHRVICADDARNDPRTRELAPYFQRHDITALLDCPVYEKGVPIGIVCHEHVGGPRAWSKEDGNFATTVSDMLGLYLEQEATQRNYRSLLATRDELAQARVMESVGRMAAGVAHDFNNVLSALGMCSDLLRTHAVPTRALVDASVEESHTLIEQGARLVRQLLDVARQRPSADVVDLTVVVRELGGFLRTLEGDGVRTDLQLLATSAPVRIERSRLEQVITNLAVNARDAMLGGGTLTLTVTRDEPVDGQPGKVMLRVRDTGVGMDEHTREHMFDPYFTTKGEGQGHGLGLSTLYRIVHDASGTVRVQSAPGAGTEFVIELPAAR